MFIKILTPNHNGKIELTVKDLECLIQEAVDKATKEKCAGCSRGYYYGNSYPLTTTTPSITLCSGADTTSCVNAADATKTITTKASDTSSVMNTIGKTIGINKNMLD